jgi:hypothetical protein
MISFLLSSSSAQVPSTDEPECSSQGIGKLQLSKEDVTIVGLTIGSASLKDVKAKLGETDSLQVDYGHGQTALVGRSRL